MLEEIKDLRGKSAGIVQTQYFTFDRLKLENDGEFGPVTLAYEAYGE